VPGPVALVYGDELMKHHLSNQHPLQPIRVKLTMDLIRSTGLIEHCHLLPPRRATIKELELPLVVLDPVLVSTSGEQLLDAVWGFDFGASSNVVDVYVGYLRSKLEQGVRPRLLQTVRGVGYILKEE